MKESEVITKNKKIEEENKKNSEVKEFSEVNEFSHERNPVAKAQKQMASQETTGVLDKE